MADFQKYIKVFKQRDIRIIGASVDPIDEARKTQTEHQLDFPLLYDLDAVEFSRLTGAFYNPERLFLDGTGFIIDPQGIIRNAVYATGPIGRYTPRECIAMIAYFREKDSGVTSEQTVEFGK